MNTCTEHDNCVVVYVGRKCPVCDLQEEVTLLEKEVKDLENKGDD